MKKNNEYIDDIIRLYVNCIVSWPFIEP